MHHRLLLIVVVATCCLLMFAAVPALAADGQPADSLRVMSFNIRYGSAKDGKDAWELRREMLVDNIKAFAPDLLGMQEVLATQGDYLQEKLADYTYIGGGRDDGKRAGEASPIMFRKDRFERLADGQFWLSETPDKVASKGWDAALPRVATWVRLKDRRTGKTVFYMNTHWDHMGKTARVESAKVMRKQLDRLREGSPVVVTGDFNTTEDLQPYKTLTQPTPGDDKSFPLIDTYRTAHPKVEENEATFHGFKGTTTGKRIDWILHSPDYITKSATIDRTNKEGRYPSDHYAVTAVITER